MASDSLYIQQSFPTGDTVLVSRSSCGRPIAAMAIGEGAFKIVVQTSFDEGQTWVTTTVISAATLGADYTTPYTYSIAVQTGLRPGYTRWVWRNAGAAQRGVFVYRTGAELE